MRRALRERWEREARQGGDHRRDHREAPTLDALTRARGVHDARSSRRHQREATGVQDGLDR
jgi:hypothetical protein